jgi:hypothetical protein
MPARDGPTRLNVAGCPMLSMLATGRVGPRKAPNSLLGGAQACAMNWHGVRLTTELDAASAASALSRLVLVGSQRRQRVCDVVVL